MTAAAKADLAKPPECFGTAQPSAFNAQQLWQHFDTLAETPDSVEKLRRLVLQLAVRGCLGNGAVDQSARLRESQVSTFDCCHVLALSSLKMIQLLLLSRLGLVGWGQAAAIFPANQSWVTALIMAP